MEPTHLLPLLALLQMLPRLVSPADVTTSASNILVFVVPPALSELYEGQSPMLTCLVVSLPTYAKLSVVWSWSKLGNLSPTPLILSEQRNRTFTASSSLPISPSNWEAGEKYSCTVWHSELMSPIIKSISKKEVRPPTPQLTMSPQQPVYVAGETVTLTCSAASAPAVSRIRFFRDDQEIHSQKLSSPPYSATHSIRLAGEPGSQAELYSCASWQTEFGREISSERSQRIRIAVAAPLPSPQLTVSPPQPVYITGEAVNLTCSAAGSPTVSGIRFYRDSREIQSKELSSSTNSHTESLPLSSVSAVSAGEYSCESWETVSGREIKSARSRTRSIRVTARPPPPSLSLDPPHPIYIRGERVTLRCSGQVNEKAAGYRFFNQSGEQISSGESSQGTWQINTSDAATSQAYTCLYWRVERGREIPSEKSPPVLVSVMDPPPQPELSVDPPFGAVSEGFPLNITCTAPGDARERRFHFYKDGVELVPGDLGSEISTMEPGTSSVKGSVLSIPWAGRNITGNFTCGYVKNVSGRWIPSPRSRAVNVTGNVTMSAHGFRWVQELAVGISFFLINGLIICISHCYF